MIWQNHVIRLVSIFLLFAFTLCAAQEGSSNPEFDAFNNCSRCAAAKALIQRDMAEHQIVAHPYDVRHYRIELEPVFALGRLVASTEITCISTEDGLAEVTFNFAGPWTIDEVLVDGTATSYDFNNSTLAVALPTVVNTGDQFVVRVSYNGVPTNYPGYQVPAFAMGENWAYTHSQPFSARYWYPCFDEPTDKADDGVDILITTPNGYTAVANGEMYDVVESGQNRIFHWRHQYPIATYLIAVAVNLYDVIEDEYEGVDLNYYVYLNSRGYAEHDFGRHDKMLKLFNEKFGKYPFDSYGCVMIPASGWAMENQTMTFYSDGIITGDRRYEQTVAHELAHHWWGDSVTLDDYRHIWLNEGFASFAQIVWAESLGEEAKAQTLAAFHSSLVTDDQRNRHSLYRGDYTELFSRTIYRKGGYVLHMLRWELGDDDFFEGLRTYHQRFKYGTAVTDDFQDVMEEVSGKDLDGFFEGWVYGTHWPRFAISSYDVEMADGLTRIITIQQTQDDPTIFTVTLPIDPDGNGPLPTGRYLADGDWAQFEVPVGQGVSDAIIKETDWLLMETETADYPKPSVKKIKGRKLRAGRNGRITLTGENFTPATRVFFDSPDVTIRKLRVNNDGTEIKIKVKIADDAEKSKFGFRVINPDGDADVRGKGLRIISR